MSDKSNIEWTDATWPVVTGCEKVSQGCKGCYAIRDGWRLSHNPNPAVSNAYARTVRKRGNKLEWTGRVNPLLQRLDWPLKWKKPRRIFVCNQSDLFHEAVPDGFIDRVFAVMALCPQHTFQILTKRPERMREYMTAEGLYQRILYVADNYLRPRRPALGGIGISDPAGPVGLQNIWLGVSCEDQMAADERIPLLLQTPAAVRFVSAEPLLGPVDLRPWLSDEDGCESCDDGEGFAAPRCSGSDLPRDEQCPKNFAVWHEDGVYGARVTLNWIIVGGESGPGARPCDVQWIRSIVEQCLAAGVSPFVKQLGARPIHRCISRECRGGFPGQCRMHGADGHGNDSMLRFFLLNRKGGDPSEWPADLRVREMPA